MTTANASHSSAMRCAACGAASTTASTWAATLSGACSTTSSGLTAIGPSSASAPWIPSRSNAVPSRARRGSGPSPGPTGSSARQHRKGPVRVTRVPTSLDDLTALAYAHAAAEALDDPEPVMVTLEDDCVYELQPVGLVLEGLDLARRYYDHFFSTFRPQVAGYTLRSEWRDERGV